MTIMKSLLIAALAFALSVTAAGSETSPAPTAPAPGVASKHAPSELAALEQFLNRSDAELAQMEQIIARLRAMSSAERAALRDEIAAFRRLPESQRLQLRQGWGQMPPDVQAGWREMMQHATPERRAEIHTKLQSLSPGERTNHRRELVEAYLQSKTTKKSTTGDQ